MPGDMALYDTTRPYRLVSEGEMRHIVLMFLRASMDLTTEDLSELTARRLPADRAMCQMLSPFLLRLASNFESLHGVPALRLAHPTIDLVTTLFASELDAPLEGSLESRRRLLGQIKSFVEANLDDDALTPPPDRCRELHLSPSAAPDLPGRRDNGVAPDPDATPRAVSPDAQ
ncbi:AraC-like ligand-binding domain-containing protein [Nocardioides dilutus]